jgi:4-nitrophenyl phosphatase
LTAARGTLIFDLDGVVYVGDHPVAGAGDLLHAATSAGYSVLFATNNASRTPENAVEKLRSITGYPAVEQQYISSALAGAHLLGRDSVRCFVVGGPGIHHAVAAQGSSVVTDWRHAEAVLVGFDREVAYPTLRDATLALRAGARFIATNDDATFPAPDGQWPGAGATVAFLQTSGGRTPEVAGKPHPPMRALIRERLGPGPVWMIGDRPETDLAMAKAEGWTAVLALSGVTDDPGVVPAEYRPDLVVASLANLGRELELLA